MQLDLRFGDEKFKILTHFGLSVFIFLKSEAKAEDTQRQALALRCEEWESASAHGDESCGRMHALKRAALPCLLNLGSFVSNQGRYMDAEVILVSDDLNVPYPPLEKGT